MTTNTFWIIILLMLAALNISFLATGTATIPWLTWTAVISCVLAAGIRIFLWD